MEQLRHMYSFGPDASANAGTAASSAVSQLPPIHPGAGGASCERSVTDYVTKQPSLPAVCAQAAASYVQCCSPGMPERWSSPQHLSPQSCPRPSQHEVLPAITSPYRDQISCKCAVAPAGVLLPPLVTDTVRRGQHWVDDDDDLDDVDGLLEWTRSLPQPAGMPG